MLQEKTIHRALPNVFESITVSGLGKKQRGKVRDFYLVNGKRVLITTDRLSAFDVILGLIPYKGAVLNQLSEFWFKKTRHIIPNHMISVPDPNVMMVRDCQPIPIEMIVRGYITGVTKTSIWYSYQKGERVIYGLKFPEGLKKNQKLPHPIITPTTHPKPGTGKHDERLTKEEIISSKIVSKKMYTKMEKTALALFDYGSQICIRKGLILVDVKYEFGLHKGRLMLMDEMHTPDSARFWVKKSYKTLLKKGKEPDNYDKEFLRLWYAKHGYSGDGVPPEMPKALVVAVAKRYVSVYEKITGRKFPSFSYPIESRITENIRKLNLLSEKS